jgi:UDP-N-acetylglucosamine 2-epimerase (non-hydrolysing)
MTKPRRAVLAVVGTRPEVVKMAPVVAALRRRGVRTLLVGTAQHRELMDGMLATFSLKLDYDLDLMRPGQSPEGVLAAIQLALPRVLRAERPALALVQGDTTTALGAALCCAYQRVPVGHVEAGLRSFDRSRPFPEEMNRVLIDQVADLMFAPTRDSRANLMREGVPGRKVFVTGNTVVDAVQWLLERKPPAFPTKLKRFLTADGPKILMTAHRRESFGAPLREIFFAVNRLLERYPTLHVVYPVHPNPAVSVPARRLLRSARVLLAAPMDYATFIRAAKASDLILSDSGGVQEEAPTLGRPLLVLRDVTERPEVLKTGLAALVGTDPDAIVRRASKLLDRRSNRNRTVRNPFGDGRAGEKIAGHVLDFLRIGQNSRRREF